MENSSKKNRRVFINNLIAILLVAGMIIAGAMAYVNYYQFHNDIHSEDKKVFMPMIKVIGGSFQMGATSEQVDFALPNESPVHQVEVKDFYIGRYEVTMAQFARFVAATGYQTDAERGDDFLGKCSYAIRERMRLYENVNWRCDIYGNTIDTAFYHQPVTHVTLHDATAFCDWLSERYGRKYRLPTEAEWEYAARGGAESRNYIYSGSNDASAVAWHYQNCGRIREVGLKQHNELGIHDMSGNVSEWCGDEFFSYSESKRDQESTRAQRLRNYCIRGGNFISDESVVRVSTRFNSLSYYRCGNIGFRVVCTE